MKQITLLLTGGIGSGKTTVAKYLNERYGIPVFYSDEEAKKLYDNPEFLSQVNEIVDGGIIANDGTLDKKALAAIIFSDETKKQQVEALVHPKVRENFRLWKEIMISPIVIMESAIALQNGNEGFDYVVFVDAPELVRLERTMKRDNSSREKILARMKSQKLDRSLADFIIFNEFDFKESADDLIRKLPIRTDETRALFAGSFDPFTKGHLSIVKQACAIFDTVYLCIAQNTGKTRRYSVPLMNKAIKESLDLEGIKNCEVIVCDRMVADVCRDLKVKYLIRGLRNTSDYLYEENISKINHEINPNLEVVYLRSDNDIISSSMVYEFMKFGKSVDAYVPTPVLQIISLKGINKRLCVFT